MEIRTLTTKEEILPLLPLLRQLTQGLTEESLSTMLDDMLPKEYKVVAVFWNDQCMALSGYWIGTKFYSGKYLEMDNVIVEDYMRSKGLGRMLLEHCAKVAKENNCSHIMLDVYVENIKAHVFYERHGFTRRGYHFLKKI